MATSNDVTANRFQRLFLRQYGELHESKSRKRILLLRIFNSFLGSVVITALMGMLLFFVDAGAFQIFIPFGAGLILGNLASQLGGLIRRAAAWDVVEEITDWQKVYEILGKHEDGGKR